MTTGGNTYDKYGSSNPIERRLVTGFLEQVAALAGRSGAGEAHELGCGEGEISMLLAQVGVAVRGSDRSAEAVAEARSRAARRGLEISFKAAPIEALEPGEDGAELIVCCEVLEHLPDPEAGLTKIAELARPWALISVPREPLWRGLNLARGSYVRELGNTPGHLNHYSRRGFRRLVESRLEIVALRSPLPWSMALCRSGSVGAG